MTGRPLTALEICAGAGGQALGLHSAGFQHLALVENDPWCAATLRAHRAWKDQVREVDVHEWRAEPFAGTTDLFAGGVPCPPFSRAGRQLGADDERDLFPAAMRLIRECKPRAVLLENVRGILTPRFADYRRDAIERPLSEAGYVPRWRLLHAAGFGVPQLRPRAILVALRPGAADRFLWPEEDTRRAPTVGAALQAEMARGGWEGAREWAAAADAIAPTLVGGSKKHGGPDLGPTQAKKRWAALGVNAHLLADAPPPSGFAGMPMLTVKMAAILQGFPPTWPFAGRKTHAYRQVGNAFPPPVAEAVGRAIAVALRAEDQDVADTSPREVGEGIAESRPLRLAV